MTTHVWTELVKISVATVVGCVLAGLALMLAADVAAPDSKSLRRAEYILLIWDRGIDILSAGIGIGFYALWTGAGGTRGTCAVVVATLALAILALIWGRLHGRHADNIHRGGLPGLNLPAAKATIRAWCMFRNVLASTLLMLVQATVLWADALSHASTGT